MKRRNFIRTVGSIATVSTVTALSGCTGDNASTNDGTNSSGTPPDSNPDTEITDITDSVTIKFRTTERFNDNVSYEGDEVTLYGAARDGDEDQVLVLQYPLTINPANEDQDCVETEVTIKAYDSEDTVIEEDEFIGNTYDAGETYEVEHTIGVSADRVDRLVATFDLNQLGMSCHT